MADVRLIIDPPSPGPWNMAVDDALLGDAIENGHATLRFYQWSEPTLSLGYFQRYADRGLHAASRASAIVRRQSGGGAILHDRELTYSLVLPPGHSLAARTPQLYASVHQAFIAALSKHDSNNPSGHAPLNELRIRGDEARSSTDPKAAADEPFLCFQRRSPGDVVLVAASHERPSITDTSKPLPVTEKILGSAQRRHRGAILQHGSLLIETSPAAPELPGLQDLAAGKIRVDSLIPAVCDELARSLNFRFAPYELSSELQSKAADLANNKYGAASWTNRR